jgi:hypothetical protein
VSAKGWQLRIALGPSTHPLMRVESGQKTPAEPASASFSTAFRHLPQTTAGNGDASMFASKMRIKEYSW